MNPGTPRPLSDRTSIPVKRFLIWILSVPAVLTIAASVLFLFKFHDRDLSDTVERWGQTGDYFGGVLNPVLAFASLLALCYTLLMQFRNAAETARFNAIQRLESLIFELLRLHRENLSSIEVWSSGNQAPINGRPVLRTFLSSIKTDHEQLNIEIPTEATLAECYRRFYEDGHRKTEVGHYFRNLYHIFKHISTSPLLDDEERLQYAKLVRAQLSTPETALLFYNGLHPHGLKFRRYVSDFALLQELEPKDLGIQGLTQDIMTGIYGKQAFTDSNSAA
jgi:Putative phage abortive infection protein